MYIFNNVNEIVFVDDNNCIEHRYATSFVDYDDFFEVCTQVTVDERIRRGWVGDILVNFVGYDLVNNTNNTACRQERFTNVLCTRVKFEKSDSSDVVEWTYTFNKY